MVMQLVKKDFIYLTTALRSTFITMLFFTLMPLARIEFGIMMPSFIFYIGAYSICAYKEKQHVHLLEGALPVTRKQICLSEYIKAAAYIVLGTALGLIGIFLHNLCSQSTGMANQYMVYLSIMIIIGSLYAGILLPVIFKFGTIKTRYVMMFSYIIIFALAGGMNAVSDDGFINIQMMYVPSVGIAVLGAVIIFVVSYIVSLSIWQGKEFK